MTKIQFRAGLMAFALVTLLNSVATAKNTTQTVYFHPQKHRTRHGKPLFNYPTENPSYIVTYTEDDMRRLQQKEFLQKLK